MMINWGCTSQFTQTVEITCVLFVELIFQPLAPGRVYVNLLEVYLQLLLFIRMLKYIGKFIVYPDVYPLVN